MFLVGMFDTAFMNMLVKYFFVFILDGVLRQGQIQHFVLGHLLLTWFNWNPSMDT